jgi:FG-GAP-like repeat
MRCGAVPCGALMAAMLALSCAALVAFPEKSPAIDGGIRFTDVTNKSGLNFQQSYGDRHLDNIAEGTGTGVCVFDYNNDGFLDVYFPNGKWTQGVSDDDSRDLRGKLTNHLFRNNGDGTFTDVTVEAGLGGSRYSVGCAAADYDNDGYVDLLVIRSPGRGKLVMGGKRWVHPCDKDLVPPSQTGPSYSAGGTSVYPSWAQTATNNQSLCGEPYNGSDVQLIPRRVPHPRRSSQ